MITNEDQAQLTKAAMALRSRAPAEWDEFLKALDLHRATRDNQLVTCLELAHLGRFQGFALSIRELLSTLTNAPQLYSQMMAKGPNSGQRKP